MISGQHPFEQDAKDDDDIHMNIIQLKYVMPVHLYDTDAISFIKHTLCKKAKRLNGQTAPKHRFIAPHTENALQRFNWPPTEICTKTYPMYYDNRSFFKMIPNINININIGCDWRKIESEEKSAPLKVLFS